MAITYSTYFQDRIAYRLHEAAYSTLSTNQKGMIDGGWTTGTVSATNNGIVGEQITVLQQYGQWMDAAGAQVAQTAWDAWFVASVVRKAGSAMRPDRLEQYIKAERDARAEAIESFSRKALTVDPASDTEYASNTYQNIRYHVLSQTVRRSPRPLWIAPETIDSCTNRITMHVWNSGNWTFKKRPVTMEIKTITATAVVYANSDKSLTLTGAFADYTHVAGALLLITDSTDDVYNGRVVEIASKSSDDKILLTQALGANNTSVTCRTLTVAFPELGTETFDSTATRKFFYLDNRGELTWADGTDMAQGRAGLTLGYFNRPSRAGFTTNGTKRNWFVYPWPDQDYTLAGDVYVTGPGSPSSASDTTPFARFPAEFAPILRDMVYAECLYTSNQPDGAEKRAAATADLNTALVKYAATGDMETANAVVRDVYRDVQAQRSMSCNWGENTLGGQM